LCLPFRTQGGYQYWKSRRELVSAVGWLAALLADSALVKVFHFGLLHDVPFLRQLGFDVAGRIVDTAALSHTAFTEFPKGLGFLATLYCWAPVWKHLKEEDEEDGKS
jgi:ribonuclease D